MQSTKHTSAPFQRACSYFCLSFFDSIRSRGTGLDPYLQMKGCSPSNDQTSPAVQEQQPKEYYQTSTASLDQEVEGILKIYVNPNKKMDCVSTHVLARSPLYAKQAPESAANKKFISFGSRGC